MYLDISNCQLPDPTLFETLLLEKLKHSYGNQPAPHRISTSDTAHCFLVQRITETHLIAAHPIKGEQALLSALQCLQQQQLSPDTRIILLSAEPPPALAWLSQHQSLHWHRCQVLSINNDYGIFIEDSENQKFNVTPSQEPGRLQRTETASDALPLTQEEHQFFSHL